VLVEKTGRETTAGSGLPPEVEWHEDDADGNPVK
jgi:hypothetical protein